MVNFGWYQAAKLERFIQNKKFLSRLKWFRLAEKFSLIFEWFVKLDHFIHKEIFSFMYKMVWLS
jgi:hypothetical protein